MTLYLYPRLLPAEAERLFVDTRGRSPEELKASAHTASVRTVYAASGGQRVSENFLGDLAGALRGVAIECGYPSVKPPRQVVDFDRRAARLLHSTGGLTQSEGAQRQVWAFLSLVLVPDLCAWRFPPSGSGDYQADRFKANDLTRHTLARCWWRAEILRDPSAADQYHLLDLIGEAEIDQLMARRRSVGASPALARALVLAYSRHEGEAVRRVFRDVLMRLLRLTAFMDLEALTDEEVAALVTEQWRLSRSNVL